MDYRMWHMPHLTVKPDTTAKVINSPHLTPSCYACYTCCMFRVRREQAMESPVDLTDESRVDRAPAQARQARKLSPQERATLRHCENAVTKGLKTFYEVGDALKTIRNQRLYRETFASFRAYCRARWGFEAARARQFIAAADVFKDVAEVSDVQPANEAQMRSLSHLDTEHRQQVWKLATERAAQPTEALIKETIREVVPQEAEARSVAVADTAVLVEQMVVSAETMLTTVLNWDVRQGLGSDQRDELRRLIQKVRLAMRDVEVQLR